MLAGGVVLALLPTLGCTSLHYVGETEAGLVFKRLARSCQKAGKSYATDEKNRPLHRVIALRAVTPSERKVEVL
jgi:hypothetical protein